MYLIAQYRKGNGVTSPHFVVSYSTKTRINTHKRVELDATREPDEIAIDQNICDVISCRPTR